MPWQVDNVAAAVYVQVLELLQTCSRAATMYKLCTSVILPRILCLFHQYSKILKYYVCVLSIAYCDTLVQSEEELSAAVAIACAQAKADQSCQSVNAHGILLKQTCLRHVGGPDLVSAQDLQQMSNKAERRFPHLAGFGKSRPVLSNMVDKQDGL